MDAICGEVIWDICTILVHGVVIEEFFQASMYWNNGRNFLEIVFYVETTIYEMQDQLLLRPQCHLSYPL